MFLNDAKHSYRPPLHHLFFSWQRSFSLLILTSGVVICTLASLGYLTTKHTFPSFPLAVIGGALGIFVSFRTNSCYQRWWEGRKLWGRMINTSRHICSQSIAYLPEDDARETIERQLAYVHALRCVLRDQDPSQDEHYQRCQRSVDQSELSQASNLNHALLTRHMKRFVEVHRAGKISEFWLSDLDESVRHLLDIQGGAERIKKTPFPPAYGYLAVQLTKLYGVFFPLAVVHDLGWWTVPLNLLICMTFQLINEVGRVLENPFSSFYPALPLSAISLTIERDLRFALGDPLPEPQAVTTAKGVTVLM